MAASVDPELSSFTGTSRVGRGRHLLPSGPRCTLGLFCVDLDLPILCPDPIFSPSYHQALTPLCPAVPFSRGLLKMVAAASAFANSTRTVPLWNSMCAGT